MERERTLVARCDSVRTAVSMSGQNARCAGRASRSGSTSIVGHRTCHLAHALTGAEQAALKVDLDGDDTAARKFFNLSERDERWRDYRVDPPGSGSTASRWRRAKSRG